MRLLQLAVALTMLMASAAAWAQVPGAQAPPVPGEGAPPPGAPGPGVPPPMHPVGPAVGPSPLMVVRVPPAPYLVRLQEELNLSEDQRSKAKEAMDKYTEKSKPLMDQYRDSTRALQETANSAKLDAAKLKAAAAKSLKAEEALVNASIDFWTEFRGILTTEQNQKLSESLSRWFRPGFGFGPMGPGAPMPPPAPPAPK